MAVQIDTTPQLQQSHVTFACGHGGPMSMPNGTSDQDARELADLIICWRCQDTMRHEYRPSVDPDFDWERGDPWA